jgi:hypothetical protein
MTLYAASIKWHGDRQMNGHKYQHTGRRTHKTPSHKQAGKQTETHDYTNRQIDGHIDNRKTERKTDRQAND